MKIVPKLTLAMAIGALAVMAVDTSLRVLREIDLFQSDMRQDHEVLGRAVAAGFVDVWNHGSPREAMRMIQRANAAEPHVRVRWISLDQPPGSPRGPVAGVDEDALRDGTEQNLTVRRGAGAFYTYVPAVIADHSGAIELAESLDQERRYVLTTVASSVFLTLALGATFLIIAFYLGDRVLGHPIRRLAEQTQRIGRGELGATLELERNDELGELAAGMNSMSADLAKAQRRILAETETRIDALKQLRHADRLNTVGKLASGVAHELGTPLNVIGARAKMIETGGVAADAVPDNARIIREQSVKVTRIIRQLLDFARPRGPRKTLCDLALVARSAADLLLPLARKRQVEIEVQVGEGETLANVDPDQINQVLANLIGNGIQAMPGGGTLLVRVEPREHGMALSVIDEGVGMDAETASRVFEPFFTTKPVGEGTGLGLSVSFGIVREHGGRIDVESEPGKGAQFTVFLPKSADGGAPEHV